MPLAFESNKNQKLLFGCVYLHLNRLTVDEFAGRDDILEDDGSLLATVQDDVVHLALDLDGRTLAAVNVNRLVHVRVLNDLKTIVMYNAAVSYKYVMDCSL